MHSVLKKRKEIEALFAETKWNSELNVIFKLFLFSIDILTKHNVYDPATIVNF